MSFLKDKCTLYSLTADILSGSKPFSCSDEDLDDFFRNDAVLYQRQKLGKSYCYRLDETPDEIVCAFTLSNSSLDIKKIPNNRRKKVLSQFPHSKYLSSYPAVLIGRLGVNANFAGKGIGTELMSFVKQWMNSDDIRTGCRFLTVDAYNNGLTRKYYENNGFLYLFSSEEQEKEYLGLTAEDNLKTRLMYFDLLRIA